MVFFSKFKDFVSHKVDIHDIRPGDHLYVWSTKKFYSHHGIAIGNNMIINVTSVRVTDAIADKPINRRGCTADGCGYGRRDDTSVFKICLDCFKDNRPVYRYRYGVSPIEHMFKIPGTCTMATSLPEEQVIESAELILLNGFQPYGLADNNCEDFALFCKTNLRVEDSSHKGTSGQVNGVRALLVSLVAGAGASALTYKYKVRGNRLVRVTPTTFALAFVTARHFYDLGVRADAGEKRTRELLMDFTKGERDLPDDEYPRVNKPLEEYESTFASKKYIKLTDPAAAKLDPLRYRRVTLIFKPQHKS